MGTPRHVVLDGKPYLWRDLLLMRKEQRDAARGAEQPTLFEIKEDCRPATQRNAAGRYQEPSLLELLEARNG